MTQASGAATAIKQYNEQGFLITTSAGLSPRSSASAIADLAGSSTEAGAGSPTKMISKVHATATSGALKMRGMEYIVGAALGILGVVILS